VFSSSLALGATLGAGGLLLFLNVIVLAAILYQRARRAQRRRKRNSAPSGGAERADAEGGGSCERERERGEAAAGTCVAAIAGTRAKHKQVQEKRFKSFIATEINRTKNELKRRVVHKPFP